MPNKWRYYEGTTSANSILKDMAKVLCTAVKDDEIKDESGNLVKASKIIQERNWDIVYPPVNRDAVSVADWGDLTPDEFEAKINNQLAQSTDTIILKTTTTPVTLNASGTGVDDIGLEDDLSVKTIDMYVEFYKPRYLADPEKYHPESERFGIKPYNVTRSIYEEFSSTTGYKEINVLTSWGSRKTDTQNAMVKTQLVPEEPTKNASVYATEFKPSATTANAKLAKYIMEKVEGSVPTYSESTGYMNSAQSYTSGYLSIDALDEEGKTLLSQYLSSSLGEKSVDDYSTYKVSFVIDNYDYANRPNYTYYKMSVSVKRETLNYQLVPFSGSGANATGFKVVLPEYDKIRSSTIKFIVDKSEQKRDTVWSYDMASGTITLKTAIPTSGWMAVTTPDREPVITYEYEKEQAAITGRKLLYNNHYIYMRMFDEITDKDVVDMVNARTIPAYGGPLPNDIDENTGEVIKINSHVSEWAKLSWYQDYEEVMIDELDSDVGNADLSQGIIFLPIETPGLNGDTRIRFWVNTNNDRAVVMLMGNPSLDFSTNRHLTSMIYLGKIESFENSINDTAGNFALFTSSSTVPCSTATIKKRVTIPSSSLIGVGNDTVTSFPLKLAKGQFFDRNVTMTVTQKTIVNGVTTEQILEVGLYNVSINAAGNEATVTLTIAPANGVEVWFGYAYYEENIQNVDGIIRDSFGNILEIRYPDNWGKNTATGVTDVCMLHTRSKAYFQKHHFMFTTTEEYMTKEMYGKSAYTGEYYADKIKITHGNDGPRGMLQDVLVIDQSSLVALDELIVNREFSKDALKPEETYVFFPVNAAFSPFSGSPNALYGVAMKKAFKNPAPKDDAEAVQRAVDDLYIGRLTSVRDDILLPADYADGVTITWAASDADIVTIADPV